MKIDHVDGSATDTDKLDDVSAYILEIVEELRKFCHDNRRQCVLLVETAPKNGMGKSAGFWNMTLPDTDQKDQESVTQAYRSLIDITNTFVTNISHGQLIIAPSDYKKGF